MEPHLKMTPDKALLLKKDIMGTEKNCKKGKSDKSGDYKCKKCGAMDTKEKHLCKPVKIKKGK